MANSYLFQDQPQTGDALPTGELANIARDQESAFVKTAPSKGYLNPQMSNTLDPNLVAKIQATPTLLNEGFVKGYLAGQENQRQNITSNIDQTKLNMMQEQQGWARTDREQQRAINDGMADAAQQGGFSGVINYLQVMDPQRALSFMAEKNKLDQSMMQTDVMKSLVPNEKAQALVEGYGILGKMGQAILGASPNDRAAMYNNILPIIRKVNPDAPSTLNSDAAHMLLLGAAQADPANQLFANGLAQTQARNASDVLNARIMTRMNNGETMSNSPGLKQDVEDLQSQEIKFQTAKQAFDNSKFTQNNLDITKAKTQQEMANSVQKQNTDFQSAYKKDSENYLKFLDENTKFDGAMQQLQQNPNNPAAQTAAFLTLQGLYTRGKMTPDSKSMFANSDSGVDELMKKLNNEYTNNNKVVMTPEEIQRLSALQQSAKQSYDNTQALVDSRYSKMADQFDPDGKYGLKTNLPLYTMQNNNPAYINQKADSMIQQAQGNTALIQKIESARQQMLNNIKGTQ